MESHNTGTNSSGSAADGTSLTNQPATSQPDGTATVSHSTPQVDSPSPSTPLTLEQVQAAIPEHGITLEDLRTLFRPYITGFEGMVHFLQLVIEGAERDPITKLIMPKGENETPPERVPGYREPDDTDETDVVTPSTPLTLEQVKAAIPEHGIALRELHNFVKPHIASMGFLEVAKLLARSGEYDPAKELFMPRKKSKIARKNTHATTQTTGTAATFHSGAQAVGLAPVVPLTVEEVKAAIPEEGIALGDLVKLFKDRVILKGDEAITHFIKLVKKSGKQDATTKLIVPKKETESLVEREA